MEGWIKLHRKLCKWEWYTDVNTCHLFIHILINANHEPAKWRGITINKGQYLTGREALAIQTGLSQKSVRTSLNKLKTANVVAIESSNQYSIISIVKWDDYQMEGQQTGQRGASEGPARGQPTGHKQEDKNDKNKKKEEYMPTLFSEIESKNIPDGFETFWEKFPKARAGNKDKAHQAWKKALTRSDKEKIIQGLQAYCASEMAKNFPKGAAAWLNDDRWSWDYSPSPAAPAGNQQKIDYRPANPARNRKVIT